ncbi:transketolase C-terminal domain-containing protein [Selenomonas sp. TAMA-11512]|uniref:transketolase family protein n=1 Tax=Selenomonas sp. TAMA-11512 TaxID=3095337 RepID=UPI0030892982|nr:transketolase C-terminal domain-containing protein [Selenomonas sp. TAMA-11512]
MRNTFVETLTAMAREDEKVVCVIGDTGFSVFEPFEKEFGARFVNVGIAEQNFVSFGAGLSAMGMKPYLYNVVSFMTLRAMEQIVLDVSYQENPVVLVGVGGGHAYETAGPTHHAYFDIAMMRMLPNMTVICPADPIEMRAVILASKDYGKPLYIRIGRSVDPVVHEKEISFSIGKGLLMCSGTDGALLATGVMVKDALKARKILQAEGVHIAVYSVPTIKPLDEVLVRQLAETQPAIFTLEEGTVQGGLGSAVLETLFYHAGKRPKFHAFGFSDQFAPFAGTRDYLNAYYGADPASVAVMVKRVLENV